jgi:putative DNA primase/helicase
MTKDATPPGQSTGKVQAPPAEMRALRQWLIWRFEAHEQQGKKPRKMPYYAAGGRRIGKQGDERDRARLVTYDEALRHAPAEGKGGIGFAFLPNDGLAGIDLDGAFDEEVDKQSGEIKRWPSERTRGIVGACASFTEISPSGKGLHIYVKTDVVGEFKSFKNNSIGVEVFCSAQFFTFTGQRFGDAPLELASLDEKTLARLRATVRAAKPRGGSSSSSPAAPADDDQRRADSALAYVDADTYQTWIDIGHVLKFAFGDGGLALWDRYSMRSAKYAGADEIRRRWSTFNPNGALKLGTLFELAKRGGWQPPRAPSRSSSGNAGKPPAEAVEESGERDDRPVIRWIQGELPRCVNEAEDSLIKSRLGIYQRAGFLVRVVRRDTPSVRHAVKRPPGALSLVTIDTPYLIEAMTRAASWEKWNARAKPKTEGDPPGDWVPMNAPEQAAQTYLSRRGHWQVPRLWSAISAPTLRPDGTVLQEPGYDAATQSWYEPCGIEFPKIPDKPSREDALQAFKRLDTAFGSFPFDTKADKAVALALALTAIVRRSLPSAPLGAITAPVMASGKTLLADSIAILATGVSAPAMKYADTDEEATKTMLAVLAEGDQVVLIDNVERPLQGDTLCAVLTSETYRQRMLGRTEMMSVPTTTLFLATGNHLVIAGDLRTRALLCRIDPKVERPEERQFGTELRSWMIEHRPELVAAGLTIMRAFIATGQDPRDFCKTWGRFERWSDMVRAPLLWLECADPCATLKDLEREDPDRIELARVLSAWKKIYTDVPTAAREAIKRANDAKAAPPGIDQDGEALELVLREICRDRDGSLNVKRLGHWLRMHADRLVDGLRLARAGERDHSLLWKIDTMKKN